MINHHQILMKFSRREATAEEQDAFREWLGTLSAADMQALLDEYGDIIAGMPEIKAASNETLLSAIHAAIEEEETTTRDVRRRIIPMRWMWAAAAVVVLAIATAGLLLQQHNATIKSKAGLAQVADLPPGKTGAILTLSNGKQLVLDSIGNGLVASDGGAETVLHNGKLIYNVKSASEETVAYNVVTTPKGRQFQVELPDGTIVWLNAASSINYPTAFTGNKREVTIRGEAYFEVMKNARMPFVVHAAGKADIEVLGTHFNVEAYDNIPTLNTTLLEGSIKVNGTLITPGQQAQVDDVVHVVNNADTSKVMAWKNGLFNFEGATLSEVMKQLERWYDIEVVYEKGVPDIVFGGEMTKNISLSGLLLALEGSDIHFRLEGRKLIVLP